MVGFLLSVVFIVFGVVTSLIMLMNKISALDISIRDKSVLKMTNQIPYLLWNKSRIYFSVGGGSRHGYLERLDDSEYIRVIFKGRGSVSLKESVVNADCMLDFIDSLKKIGAVFYRDNIFHKRIFLDSPH